MKWMLLFWVLLLSTLALASHSSTLGGGHAHGGALSSPPTVAPVLAIVIVAVFGLGPFVIAYLVYVHRVPKKERKKHYKAVPQGKEFKTMKGNEITTLEELASYLEKMDDEEFSHHVNDEKNDFAAWVGAAVGYEALGAAINKVKTKEGILKLLKS